MILSIVPKLFRNCRTRPWTSYIHKIEDGPWASLAFIVLDSDDWMPYELSAFMLWTVLCKEYLVRHILLTMVHILMILGL